MRSNCSSRKLRQLFNLWKFSSRSGTRRGLWPEAALRRAGALSFMSEQELWRNGKQRVSLKTSEELTLLLRWSYLISNVSSVWGRKSEQGRRRMIMKE